MDGEHNMSNYFTKHHPASHHRSKYITYLIPTVETSKYSYYMSPTDLRGCVEALTTQGNGILSDKVSLLHEKEMYDIRKDTNRPIRNTQYWRRQYRPYVTINLAPTLV